MKIILYIIAIFLPWLALLIRDNPGGAFVALILQATVIGWIPASIWACSSVKSYSKEKKQQQKEEEEEEEEK
jgi:uncharacterized membrane protein YqaE (UPF0057 family)